MTSQEVLVQYEEKLRELLEGLTNARFHGNIAAATLALSVSLLFVLGLYAVRKQASFLWASIPVPFAAVAAHRFRQEWDSQNRMRRLRRFYNRAVHRVRGNWAGDSEDLCDGEEFCDAAHPYARDLNVVGEGSLFKLLCTVRTATGQRGLARYLLTTPTLEEAISRQAAIHELKERADLREKVALLGDFEFLESKYGTFAAWLDGPAFPRSGLLRAVFLMTSTLLGGMILTGFATRLFPWSTLAMWIAPLLVLHATVGLLFRGRVNRMLDFLHPVSTETQVLREGLRLLEAHQFQSLKLHQLVKRIRGGSRCLRKLERQLNGLNERNKPWFYGPSLALLIATQLCMSIESWRREHGAALRVWLDAWAEFEALNALATYAYENPENTFPEFSIGEMRFEAKDLGHPLLPRESCVRNDIQLNADSRFYVVSGSNMSGKSTLLRAIGINAVLALAGAPVRARSLQMAPVAVSASVSVVDSLLNGRSKLLAEVDRLRRTLEAAGQGMPVLFLVDEIFSGTNSRDRRVAAEAVIRTLVSRGAIGAISTHDIALCEIATAELRGVNVHMGSRAGDNPMDFDYRLRQGVTDEANALAIARMAGVPV